MAQQPDLLRLLPETPHHGGRDIVRAVDAGELVGVREKIALQRLRIGIEVAHQERVPLGRGDEVGCRTQPGLLDCGCDVEDVVALGNDHGPRIDIAPNQAAPHVQRAGRFVELVLAGLQRLHAFGVLQQEKRRRAADDAFALQTPARCDVCSSRDAAARMWSAAGVTGSSAAQVNQTASTNISAATSFKRVRTEYSSLDETRYRHAAHRIFNRGFTRIFADDS